MTACATCNDTGRVTEVVGDYPFYRFVTACPDCGDDWSCDACGGLGYDGKGEACERCDGRGII